MDMPVRCFSCGKVLANKIETYKKYINDGIEAKIALDSIGAARYCCRRMFLGYVEVSEKMMQYKK
jgi:DNA-directed RNA polymerase subunit N (RpoN/RPB10)